MKLQLRGKKVAIEKIKKAEVKKDAAFLSIPPAEEYVGIIRAIGTTVESDLQVNQKVYFGKNFQTFTMSGTSLCIMDDDQILGIVLE